VGLEGCQDGFEGSGVRRARAVIRAPSMPATEASCPSSLKARKEGSENEPFVLANLDW